MTKKKIIASLLVLILVVLGLIGGVYLVKQRQEIRKLAAPATTIYFSPSTKTVNVDETVNFDILMDTGENALATVRLDIVYDSTFLQPLSLNFNSNLLPQLLRPVDLSQSGKITGSAGVTLGSLLSGTGQKVATLSFKTLSEAPSGTTIGFGTDTSAYSATTAEPVGSNLIAQKNPATVIITVPSEATLTPTPTSPPDSGGDASTPTSTPTPIPTSALLPTPTSTSVPTTTPTPASTGEGATPIKLTSITSGETVSTNRPTFSGIATPEAKITITINSPTIQGSVYADSTGNWSWTPTEDLPTGQHTVTITAVDNQGNTSTTSANFTVSAEEDLPVTGQITPIFILFLFGFILLTFGVVKLTILH